MDGLPGIAAKFVPRCAHGTVGLALRRFEKKFAGAGSISGAPRQAPLCNISCLSVSLRGSSWRPLAVPDSAPLFSFSQKARLMENRVYRAGHRKIRTPQLSDAEPI